MFCFDMNLNHSLNLLYNLTAIPGSLYTFISNFFRSVGIFLFFTGFPYLISKYAEDFGLVDEQCFPYEGKDSPCREQACPRHFGTGYHYVGGFYGACNEVLMRLELLKNGPIAVSFEVYNDFMNYKGGIYHHTGRQSKAVFVRSSLYMKIL